MNAMELKEWIVANTPIGTVGWDSSPVALVRKSFDIKYLGIAGRAAFFVSPYATTTYELFHFLQQVAHALLSKDFS